MPKLYLIYILAKTTCYTVTLVGSEIQHYMLNTARKMWLNLDRRLSHVIMGS
jgi:hypothetical protein